jgi:polyhydroxybutyrate depolymerase
VVCIFFVIATFASTAGATVAPRPSAGCRETTVATGRRIERTITIAGTERGFILDVPTSVTPGTPVPVLLDFHGFGHSGAGVWKVSKFRELAEAERFMTVYPEGVEIQFSHRDKVYQGTGWELAATHGNSDLRFATAALDRLEAEYCIDRNRVFATGFSNGAYFSHLLGCMMADRIAAIAPVSGGKRPTPCAPVRPVPALIFHGRQDDIISVADARAARDSWVQGNGCGASAGDACQVYAGCREGADVEYCEGDFAHRWPPEATARIWEFLQRHPMGSDGGRGSVRAEYGAPPTSPPQHGGDPEGVRSAEGPAPSTRSRSRPPNP